MPLTTAARLAETLLEAISAATGGWSVVRVPPAMVHTTTVRVLPHRGR
jgi:hypothetical protein